MEDTGDFVINWLLKIVVTLSLTGLVAFDLMSIMVTRVAAMDDAATAAHAASDVLARNPRATKAAYLASQNAADLAHATIVPKSWYVDKAGTIHVTLKKDARSFVFKRFSVLRPYLSVEATESVAITR